METDGFWDRNHRFSYLVAWEKARRITEDPRIMALGLAHLERFSRHDPHQAHGYALWRGLLALSPAEVALRLVERSEVGDYVRQTAPPFGGLPATLRARLVREARTPLVATDER